jgi:uncharacterized membrane protein
VRQGLLIVALSCTIVAIVCAIWSHTRLKATPTERWSARGTFLLSTGMIIGILPGLLFPRSSWISMTGSLVSMVFTVGSFVALRHVRRRTRELNGQ